MIGKATFHRLSFLTLTKKVRGARRFIMSASLVALVLYSALGKAGLAYATIYECNTSQVFTWMHGKISPDTTPNARPNSILQFDDQTGDLYAAFDKHDFFHKSQLHILQKMSLDKWGIGNLTAAEDDIVNGMYVTSDVFRLTRSRQGQYFFMHFISLENRIATGTCNQEDGLHL
jgi:hypothetical protein